MSFSSLAFLSRSPQVLFLGCYSSRKQFGTPIKKVEGYLEKLFGQEEPKKKRNDKGKDKNDTSEDKDSGELIEG
jgi:hypothetical protein